jgi:O-antigen ligase
MMGRFRSVDSSGAMGSIRVGAPAVFLILFAVGLQSAFTPLLHDNYVRITASDLVLPLSLLFSFILWWVGGRVAPSPPLQHFALWLCGLTAWLGVSVWIGYVRIGHLETWGLINKLAGFVWLIGYTAAGYALVRQRGLGLIAPFLKALLITSWIIAFYSTFCCFSYVFGLAFPFDPMTRAVGFFENPNAYGCFVAMILILEIALAAKGLVFSRGWHLFGLVLLSLALLLSCSRSAWLGAAGGLVLLVGLKSVNLRQILAVAMISGLCISPLYLPMSSDSYEKNHIVYLQDPRVLQQNQSVDHRIALTHQALELWSSAPIQGAGVGSFLSLQKQTNPEMPSTIHTSALWLLTETGIVGLALFSAFFLYFARALWRARDQSDPLRGTMITAVLAVLVVAMIASIGTELLYQRHLWFLFGIGWAMRCSCLGSSRLST